MLKQLIEKWLKPRHHWRLHNFNELSELYVSMMFRGLSLSLVGLFVPLYLLGLHYSVTSILMVFAYLFTSRAIFDLVSAKVVAQIGPKHTMLIGYFIQIISLTMFMTQSAFHWPIIVLGGVWGIAISFFFIPFEVDFSKVKHKIHGGKELGYINIMEKLGNALGPIVGGLVGTFIGPQYTFLMAVILLMTGLIPLFRSAEPVRLRQSLTYRRLPITKIRRDLFAYANLGIENTLSILLWPLFLGLFVLVDKTAYAKLGTIASLSVILAIVAAHITGRLVDKRRGREILRVSTLVNSIVHLFRLSVNTYLGAFFLNLVNDAVTIGYRLPFYSGIYNAADDLEGLRIVYISSMEAISSLAKATIWWWLVILSTTFEARFVMVAGFLIAAFSSLLIATERFRFLKSNHQSAN